MVIGDSATTEAMLPGFRHAVRFQPLAEEFFAVAEVEWIVGQDGTAGVVRPSSRECARAQSRYCSV